MITRIFTLTESPEAYLTKFKNTKKKPERLPYESFNDNAHLSAEGIKKASIDSKHLHKAAEPHGSDPFIDDRQRDNIAKLVVDLKAMQAKSEITEAQKELLKNDLKSTLQDAHKPGQAVIEDMLTDISEIISDGCLDPSEISTLQEKFNSLLNSANISDEEIEVLQEDFQAIVESSNISREDLETLRDNIFQILATAGRGYNL